MFDLIRIVLTSTLRLFRTRRSLLLENLVLRQQLALKATAWDIRQILLGFRAKILVRMEKSPHRSGP